MLDSQPQIIRQTSQPATISAFSEDLGTFVFCLFVVFFLHNPDRCAFFFLVEDDVARGLFVVVGFYFQGG